MISVFPVPTSFDSMSKTYRKKMDSEQDRTQGPMMKTSR